MKPLSTNASEHNWCYTHGYIPFAGFEQDAIAPTRRNLEATAPMSTDESTQGWVDSLVTISLMLLILLGSSATLGFAIDKLTQGVLLMTQYTISEMQ